jgi:glycosyltransferase involved in cell wall biosynthesis
MYRAHTRGTKTDSRDQILAYVWPGLVFEPPRSENRGIGLCKICNVLEKLKGTRLRIAQISTLASPVRRDRASSVEHLVWLLTRGLVELGHEVTVFASGNSQTDGELIAALPASYGEEGVPIDWQICEWINLCCAIEQSDRFDVLHSHAYLWGLPLQQLSRAPMVHTLHITPQEDNVRLWSMWPETRVTAISHCQWNQFPQFAPIATIYHGVDPQQFSFRAKPDDYVCYLGRFTDAKGPLDAIAAARELDLRIVLAGPDDEYYRRCIAPLVDGTKVEFIGYVGETERSRLLSGARALLYPIRYQEPFGLVLIEAMMCGTPIAAMRLGAVPEIVDENVTGCTTADEAEFCQTVLRAVALDRSIVRRTAIARFSAERMVKSYAELYTRVIENDRL